MACHKEEIYLVIQKVQPITQIWKPLKRKTYIKAIYCR